MQLLDGVDTSGTNVPAARQPIIIRNWKERERGGERQTGHGRKKKKKRE